MKHEDIKKISADEIKEKGVVSLRSTPNSRGSYGSGGLTAYELQEKFDELPAYIAEKVNEVIDSHNALADKTTAIDKKADDIAFDLVEEATARGKAIAAEAQARETAISAEAQARETAISAEAKARETAISAEAQARETAIEAEEKARETAIKAEESSRNAAIATEAAARNAALEALKSEILGGASGAYDTLLELEKALTDDKSGTAALLAQISAAEKAISAAEEALGGKVDTTDVSVSATPNTIAKRASSGRLAVGRAVTDADAVPYKQMREELERYLADGGGLPPDLLDGINNAIKAIDSLTAKVANLEAGLAPDMFIVDDATAYVKDIPSDAKPYAQVLAVGGMTHKITEYGENLFDISALDREGSVSSTLFFISGTTSVSFNFGSFYYYNHWNTSLPFSAFVPNAQVGKTYVFSYKSGHVQEKIEIQGITAGEPFTMTEDILNHDINFYGQEPDPETFEYYDARFDDISLVEATEELLDTPVNALDITGKNLFDCANATQYSGNGIIVSQSANSMVVQHRVSGETYRSCNFPLPEWLAGKTVTLSGKWTPQYSNTGLMRVMWVRESAAIDYYTAVTNSGGSATFEVKAKPSNDCVLCLALYTNAEGSGYAGDKCTYSDIQLEIGETATTFSPYHKTTFAIPAAVQALDGYGWGIPNGAVNGIEWDENGKPTYVKRVERRVFDGTESWRLKGSSKPYLESPIPNATTKSSANASVILCNCEYEVALISKTIRIYTGTIVAVEDWKAHLADLYASGNPLTVYYELFEPIVTDISAYFTEDNLIPVEGGGTITAVNENALAAPTTIVYQKRGV